GSECVRCHRPFAVIELSADRICERCAERLAVEEAAPPIPPTPPAQIPGYRMLRPLGGGGMGVVWLAEQSATKQTVAVKFCRGNRFAPVAGSPALRRFDVYALGVILWELLTGDHPHESSGSRDAFLHRIATAEPRRPRNLRPDLDAELEMLLLKTLSKDPDERYRTAGELADELGRWLRNETLIAGRATPFYFARKWIIRHRAAVFATAGGVLALVAATAFYIVSIHRSEAEATRQRQRAEEQVRAASRVSVGVARDQRDKGHRPRTALAHLAKALEYDPNNAQAALETAGQLVRFAENSEPWQMGEALPHEAWVESAVVGAGGKWIVAASTEKSAQVWDAVAGQPVGAPLRHEAFVSRAALSPNGRWVVTVSTEKTAQVWDAASGQPSGEPLNHEGEIRSAAFSPDGRWVVTASDDKTARIWDAATGKPSGLPLHHEDKVSSANFSPDGRWVVTASDDRTAQVWDAMSSKPIGAPLSDEDVVSSAAFSLDRRWIVTTSHDKTAQIWDAAVATSARRAGCPLSSRPSPGARSPPMAPRVFFPPKNAAAPATNFSPCRTMAANGSASCGGLSPTRACAPSRRVLPSKSPSTSSAKSNGRSPIGRSKPASKIPPPGR
ncbi:MAG: WD40 repeat domain-containing serine/threonine-protein kinase, partial [Chthoniobacteraceae bacterium]